MQTVSSCPKLIQPQLTQLKWNKKKQPKITLAVKTAHRIRLNIYLFSYLLIIQATPESLWNIISKYEWRKIEYIFQG